MRSPGTRPASKRWGETLQLIDDSLISPLALSKDDGDLYKVFTPFSRRCRSHLHQPPPLDNYPAAIVDYAVARKISLALFQDLVD